MKNIIKNTAILTIITLVAGVLLGLVYEVTKEPIVLAKEKAKNEVEGKGKKMIDVQSIADYNNPMFSNIQISKNQNSSGNSPVYFSV